MSGARILAETMFDSKSNPATEELCSQLLAGSHCNTVHGLFWIPFDEISLQNPLSHHSRSIMLLRVSCGSLDNFITFLALNIFHDSTRRELVLM